MPPVRTLAIIGFVVLAFGIGLWVATRPTILDGAEMVELLRGDEPRIARCEAAILTSRGADIHCTLDDGQRRDYFMNRRGTIFEVIRQP